MKRIKLIVKKMAIIVGVIMAFCFFGCSNPNSNNDDDDIVIHTHSYGTEWSVNASQHWHECSCGDEIDIENHTIGDWSITQTAGIALEGRKTKECGICLYVADTEEIQAIFDGTWIGQIGVSQYLRIDVGKGFFVEYIGNSPTTSHWSAALIGNYQKNAQNPVSITITDVHQRFYGPDGPDWFTWDELTDPQKATCGGTQTQSFSILDEKFTFNGVAFERQAAATAIQKTLICTYDNIDQTLLAEMYAKGKDGVHIFIFDTGSVPGIITKDHPDLIAFSDYHITTPMNDMLGNEVATTSAFYAIPSERYSSLTGPHSWDGSGSFDVYLVVGDMDVDPSFFVKKNVSFGSAVTLIDASFELYASP